MSIKELNSVFDLEWNPRIVIEASAGTGKTYTIVGLYVRLLIEEQIPVEKILVMTFTKKATAELRGRILERLRECRRVLTGAAEPNGDPFLKTVASTYGGEDAGRVTELISSAIRNFDDSRIFTIHGFCQRLLAEEPMLTGMPFEMDVIKSDDILEQAAEDFWRNFMHRNSSSDAGRYLIEQLLQIAKTPQELVDKKLKDLFSIHEPEADGEGLKDAEERIEALMALKERMKSVWQEDSAEIERDLRNCDVKRYAAYAEGRCRRMADFIMDDLALEPTAEVEKWFHPDYLFDPDNIKKDGSLPPEQRFYDLCREYVDLSDGIRRVPNEVILRAREEISERRRELSAESSALTFDDLLVKVKRALLDDETGSELADQIRDQYPYALVDEFQDTDAIQYTILDRIYSPDAGEKSGLLMIGDPKQAIYAFRGADIYTYFRAKKEYSPAVYSLTHNYRSGETLINAVNRLFEGSDPHRFLDERIGFIPSKAGRPDAVQKYTRNGELPDPMTVAFADGIFSSKSDAQNLLFRELVRQIAELLNDDGTRIEDDQTKAMRPVEARDIAILVNGHVEADAISRLLKKAGVDTVTGSRVSVFDTFEAKRLLLLMEALLDPHDPGRFSGALMSGLFGTRLSQLKQMAEEEELREEILAELQDLMILWNRRGFMPLFRKVLYRKGRLDQLAGMGFPERILTNLHHLAELISREERDSRLEPHALTGWLKRQIGQPDGDDEQTLLLESDRNLVTLTTIHSSKGLEYPIVFCPTLWNAKKLKPKLLFSYHAGDDEREVVNIDLSGSEESEEAAEMAQTERTQEEVRKAYVALTRARYDCRIFWATHKESHLSGLGAALAGPDLLREHISDSLREKGDFSDKFYREAFRKLAADEGSPIRFMEVEEETEGESVQVEQTVPDLPESAPYNGKSRLEVNRRIYSFSSLAQHKSDPAEPDYDEVSEQFATQFEDRGPTDTRRSIFTFPKGAIAGSAIHKLFEDDRVDFTTMATDDLEPVTTDILQEFGFDTAWGPVLWQMMRDVTKADYTGFSLSEVAKADRLREMEFHFPVSEPGFESLLDAIGGGTPQPGTNGEGKHYLTGFIDLIIRQNKKFFILDYKSNYLGDTREAYNREALRESVESSRYNLQYHLYTVALVNMLERTIKDFNYDTHFGGVAYLYVRGMSAGSSNGIWFHKPEEQTIRNLQTILKR